MLYYIILYYIVLYYIILYYIILYFTILYYIILYLCYYIILHHCDLLLCSVIVFDVFGYLEFWLTVRAMSHRCIVLMTFAKGSNRLSWPYVNIMNIKSLFFSRYFTYVNPYTVSGFSYSNLYSVYWCGREQGNCYKCHSLNDAIYPPSFTLAHRGHHPPSSSPKPRRLGGSEILTLTSALKEALAKGLIDLVRTRSPRSKVLAPWCEVTHAVGASGMVNGKVTSCGMYHSIVVTTCM